MIIKYLLNKYHSDLLLFYNYFLAIVYPELRLTALNISLLSIAQTAEDSVKAAVNRLFEGMKSNDAALLKSAFANGGAVLQIISLNKEGRTIVTTEPITEFADFVARQNRTDADERITFDMIKASGALATVWASYRFYYKQSCVQPLWGELTATRAL